jgi:uncharacterized membrane protein YhaH (DUF805 family)
MALYAPTRSESHPSAWWDCRRPLDRTTYAAVGALGMLVKYVAEVGVLWAVTERAYTPLDFLNPLASSRLAFTRGAPSWLTPAWILWTLPFVAIAVVFTIRRAIDAGRSPWWGLAIFVPLLNFVVMIAMACLPSRDVDADLNAEPLAIKEFVETSPAATSPAFAMLVGILVSAFYMTALTLLLIYAFDSYGSALFFGTPVVAGAFATFTYNYRQGHSWGASLWVALLPVLCVGAVLLLLAFEGAICLLMAAPIMLPLAMLGGLVGKAIADLKKGDARRRRELLGCLIVLPILGYGESRLPCDHEFCVVSEIDIAAPPQAVWTHVVDFPPISSPEPWLFRLGIAGPMGARIEGRGVGATRHCDFTTGSFVEPITVWDEPRRMAFDVTQQPEPMFELTPYREIHPPHLHGSFRSTHGEFVLEELPSGGTRLVGRTWYKLELAPHAYWTLWTDWIIHRIHGRVLEHIKTLSEAPAH